MVNIRQFLDKSVISLEIDDEEKRVAFLSEQVDTFDNILFHSMHGSSSWGMSFKELFNQHQTHES